MTLASGTRIGPYEVISMLGAGGMGEVYRARDTSLKRDVALKILPKSFAADSERLVRFQREAEVLASLNHPNIAGIHGLAETDGIKALVMELVEGKDLADRIARGPIPVNEALPVAKQIAEALEAAHERGIIHRDLKPANIKLRPDGTVKVLDFGLAKARDVRHASEVDVANSPTITSASTAVGVILGTAAYMAPEQAKGKAVDKRADIWAFGCVLYEMLTGRRAFDGETATDVITNILTKRPDFTAFPPATPKYLPQLLARCLQRDHSRRLRDIGDARLELEGTIEESDAGQPQSPVYSRPYVRPVLWIAMSVLACVAAAFVGWVVGRPSGERRPPLRFHITTKDLRSAVISPDGNKVLVESGRLLSIRDLSSFDSRELAGTDGASNPFWSPDSRHIAYGSKGRLWRISVDGGTPTVVCTLPDEGWGEYASGAWITTETVVFSLGTSGLMRVPAVGGDPQSLLLPDGNSETGFFDVSALPGGRGVLFTTVSNNTKGLNSIAALVDGRRHTLISGRDWFGDPVYTSSGHLLFARSPSQAGVWGIRFSLAEMKTSGDAFLIVPNAGQPSISEDGTLVYSPARPVIPSRLTWFDRAGGIVGTVAEQPRSMERFPSISPDGSRIAVAEYEDSLNDIWIYDVKTGERTRLTDRRYARQPRWTPDGKSIVYVRIHPPEPLMVGRVTLDASARSEELTEGIQPVPMGDGKFVIFAHNGGFYYRALAANSTPVLFLTEPGLIPIPEPSPDGHHVLFGTLTAKGQELFVAPFPSGKPRVQVTAGPGNYPRWGRDGRTIYYKNDISEIFEVDVRTTPEIRVGRPRKLFTAPSHRVATGGSAPIGFDVSPDGQRFLIAVPDRVLLTERPIAVVVNFRP